MGRTPETQQGPADNTQPSVEELQQTYDADPVVVPVHHDGPVLTHELPSRGGTMRTLALTSTEVQAVLAADLRRKRVTVIALDNQVVIGNTQSLVQSGDAATLPVNVPVVLGHSDETYARAVLAAARLVLIVERWAD